MPSQREIRRRIGSVRNIARSRGPCSSWPRPSSSEPRTRHSPRARTPRRSTRCSRTWQAFLSGEDHPLLAQREGGKRLIVLISMDRPLAGPLTSNLVRFTAQQIIDQKGGDLSLVTSAARAATPCAGLASGSRPTSTAMATGRRSPTSSPSLDWSQTTTSPVGLGRVDIVYSHFVSTLTQRPALDTLLPVEPSTDTEGIPGNQFIFEPNPAASWSGCCRATWRLALPGRPRDPRPAKSRAGWSP